MIETKNQNQKIITSVLKILVKNILSVTTLILLLVIFSSCEVKKPFSLVLLPDTQTYSNKYPEIFMAQMEWISENTEDIQFVLHQGDITNDNTDREWQNALLAIQQIDGRVPIAFI